MNTLFAINDCAGCLNLQMQDLVIGVTLVFDKEETTKALSKFQQVKVDTLFRLSRPLRLSAQVLKIMETLNILVSEVLHLS